MTDELYKGPWRVSKNDSIGMGVGIGEIIRHRSGAVILRCPKCRAMQFAHSPISGSDDTPTLTKPIQCGSGHCTRCAIWFTVTTGRTQLTEPVKREGRVLPKSLVDAGITAPPKQPT